MDKDINYKAQQFLPRLRVPLTRAFRDLKNAAELVINLKLDCPRSGKTHECCNKLIGELIQLKTFLNMVYAYGIKCL